MKKFGLILLILFACSWSHAQTRHTCPQCSGKGKTVETCSNCRRGAVYCTLCDYSGKVTSRCSSCSGRGYTTKSEKVKCDYCGGKGYEMKDVMSPCSCRGGKRPTTSRGGQTIYVDCSRCGGTGQVASGRTRAACRPCAGRGYTGYEEKRVDCYTCGGSGSITRNCSRCDGKGAYSCKMCEGYGNITRTCGRCNGNGVIYAN